MDETSAPTTVGSARVRTLPLVVLSVAAALWAATAVLHARRLWFFGDDFDFLLNRSVSLNGDHGLLVPHNEHWSTVPILIFRLNYALFGLHHYLPYALVPIVFHLLVALLVYLLLRRCELEAWLAILASLVVLFSAGGAGAENVLWDFQAGFLGSCLWGLVALVAVVQDQWGTPGRVVSVVALVLSLMSSGMGVVMVVWVALFLLAAEGLRSAFLTVALPTGVYVAWYAGYGHGHTGAPPTDLSVAPLAAMQGLGSIWSAASGMPGAGPVALLAMVLAVVLPRHSEKLFAVAGSGLVTVAVAYALLGYSRSGIGMDATVRSRYIYFGVVLTVPALAAALQVLSRALSARGEPYVGWLAWIATAAVIVSVGSVRADGWTRGREGLVSDNLHRIAAAGRLVESGAPVLRTQPMPEQNPDVTVEALQRTSVQRALPNVDPGLPAELYVEGHLQVDVGPVSRPYAPPTAIRWQGFAPVAAGQGSQRSVQPCQTRTALTRGVIEVELLQAPVQLRVAASGPHIATQLRSGDQRSPMVQWSLQPGAETYVASTARNVELRIVVPPGPVTVCTT